MPWPFSNVAAPNVDSDFVALTSSFVAVPTSPAAAPLWAMGLWLKNKTGAQVNVQVKDANGVVFFDEDIPDGTNQAYPMPLMPIHGQPLWKGAGVLAKMWGYS